MKLTLASVAAAMACTQLVQAAPVELNRRACLDDVAGCSRFPMLDLHRQQELIDWQTKQSNEHLGKDHDKSGVGMLGIPNSVWNDRDFQKLVKQAYRDFISSSNKHPQVKMVNPYTSLYGSDNHEDHTVYHLDRRSAKDDSQTSAVDVAAAT